MKTNAFTLGLVALATLALSTNLGFAQETSQESQSDVKVIDSKTTAKVVDGKVIISLADGNIRVIDLQDGSATSVKDGAKSSVVVEQKVEDDGTKQKRTGRAVIIGPDGKRQEIELDELPGLPGTAIWRPGVKKGQLILRSGDGPKIIGLPGAMASGDFAIALDGQKFRIGVSCEELDGALQAHLDLDHGLVVNDVVEDAPAEKAGVKKHDVIVSVDGDALKSVNQLVKSVQQAGDEDRKIEIRVVRKGDRAKISIKPEKRQATSWSFELPEGENKQKLKKKIEKLMDENKWEGGEFRLEKFGPGIIQGKLNKSSDMQNQIEDLRKQIEDLQQLIRELKDK